MKKIKAFLDKFFSILHREGLRGILLRISNRWQIKMSVRSQSSNVIRVYKDLLSIAGGKSTDEFIPSTDEEISSRESPVKFIAFYLPQFHPIPENDEWWGKGFTEWTNVSKVFPQFVGHYQPHLPGELGFYDLRVPEVLARQIELARAYGIHGFAFHYYWFNGKRLLEKPLELFVESGNNFPFCLCWANENWTRRWDGQESEILIAQNHSPQNDLQFIQDISPFLRDQRYIRINDRPVLIVYRPNILPDVSNTIAIWRRYCKDNGLGDPYLLAAQTFWFKDPREVGFDAAVEFPPHNLAVTDIRRLMRITNENYEGHIIDYREAIELSMSKERSEYPLFKTVFPGWDNEARKPGRGYTFTFSSPALYKEWLLRASKYALQDQDPQKRLVFINAWNEWAEGAHLEPDRKYGYAYLQATADSIKELIELNPVSRLPIIIFQPGKVGSTSVHASLEKKYQELGLSVPIHHAHILQNVDEQIEFVTRARADASNTIKKLMESKILYEQIQNHPEMRWNVISLARDPVAQKVSAVFQLIDEYIPNWQKLSEENLLGSLQKLLLEKEEFEAGRLDRWFEKQLNPVLGIDVLAEPFSRQNGFHIYRRGNLNLLIIRLEDLDRIGGQVFHEFLGITDLKIVNTNIGAEKPYHRLYEQFKKKPIPSAYLDSAYATKYARHFYTDEEIEAFRARWSQSNG